MFKLSNVRSTLSSQKIQESKSGDLEQTLSKKSLNWRTRKEKVKDINKDNLKMFYKLNKITSNLTQIRLRSQLGPYENQASSTQQLRFKIPTSTNFINKSTHSARSSDPADILQKSDSYLKLPLLQTYQNPYLLNSRSKTSLEFSDYQSS